MTSGGLPLEQCKSLQSQYRVSRMPNVTFVLPNGERETVAADHGFTVMGAALRQGIAGIEAECGGCLSCATCHVVVDAAWLDKLPPVGEIEDEMLEMVPDRQSASRLSCQIKLSDALDGITVHIPESQIAA